MQAITILYVTFDYHAQVKITRLMSIIMLLRNLRLLSLFWELSDFRKITETFQRFSMPFLTCMFSLYSVMFFYAIIGEYLFAGVITTRSVQDNQIEASNMYFLINFNDLYASMVTLFHCLVVNNWNQTTDMYCVITGSNAPRFYFTTFWIICTLIMLNIVVSFVLEIYGSIGDEIHDVERKHALARQLIFEFRHDPDGRHLAKFVQGVARQERRMMFGVNDADAYLDDITKKDFGDQETFRGRRNSVDELLGPMASNGRKRPKKSLMKEAGLASEETPDKNHGLINTLSTSQKNKSSKK